MYILNIMTENWTMMNETLPNPSLSFQGGEIWGKFFPPHPTRCVDLSPRRERYKQATLFDLDTPVKPEYDREEKIGG